MAFVDMTGFQYEDWKVIGRGPHIKNKLHWKTVCKCGFEKLYPTHSLKNNHRCMTKSCHACLGHFLETLVFGKWTVLQEVPNTTKSSGKAWKVKCECGHEGVVRGNVLRKGESKGCIHCAHPKSPIPKKIWKHIRKGAKKRSIIFTLTRDQAYALYEQQDGKCALTGLPLCLITGQDDKASLDRIDSSKGYTLDNVQWVHKNANYGKHIMSNEAYINFCRMVTEHHDKSS